MNSTDILADELVIRERAEYLGDFEYLVVAGGKKSVDMQISADINGVHAFVTAGWHACELFEGIVKVAEIRKTHPFAHGKQIGIAVRKQFSGVSNAYKIQIVDDGDAGILFECCAQIMLIVIKRFGQIIERYAAAVVFFNIYDDFNCDF